jgi:hypothetical protein
MRDLLMPLLWGVRERSLHALYRQFHARPWHVFLASYPRSGNTWLRFMLHDVLLGPSQEKHRLRRSIPDMHRGLRAIRAMPTCFIKTHYRWRAAYAKVVYLMRDPVACIGSAAGHRRSGGGRAAPAAFVRREIAGRGPYGRWDLHVRSYLESGLDAEHLLVIRYEDLVLDPAGGLESILRFCGLAVEPESIRRVAEAHTDAMLARHGAAVCGGYQEKSRRLHGLQTRRSRGALDAPLVAVIADSPLGEFARLLGYGAPPEEAVAAHAATRSRARMAG